MTIGRREIQRAEALGRLAARSRAGARSCPYEADGSPDERVLARAFVAAYLRAGGPVSVDYDDGTRTRVDGAVTIHVRKRPPVD